MSAVVDIRTPDPWASEPEVKLGTTPSSTPLARRLLNTLTVAGTLRALGGGTLVLGLINFLMTGVDVQNDLQRFLLLLLQTSVFTIGAFTLQRVLSDMRGARLLLGVALLSVPAGFAVLGAMLYGWIPLDNAQWLNTDGFLRRGTSYPGFAHWQATRGSELLLASAAALVALLPTTWFAVAVMARKASPWLVPAFVVSCSLLLVPVRDPVLISVMIIAGLVGLFALLARRGKGQPELATLEGRFVQLALFAPLLILAMRSLVMYPPSAALNFSLSLAVFALARWSMTTLNTSSRLHYLLYPVGAFAALSVAINSAWWISGFNDMWTLALATLVGAPLLRSLRSCTTSIRMPFIIEGLAATLALVNWAVASILLFPLTMESSLLVLVSHLLTPLIIFLCAVFDKRFLIALLSLIAIGDEFQWIARDLMSHVLDHGWQILVVVGLASVIAAAVIDRRWLPSKSS